MTDFTNEGAVAYAQSDSPLDASFKKDEIEVQVQPRHERVSSKKARRSDYMTVAAAAFGLISDGYQNNIMTMINVVFKKLYPGVYTSHISTRVSNALLVGEVLGQLFVGLLCDRMGRKAGLVITTLLIVLGAVLATAAHGMHGSPMGLFWFLTIARGITGVGTGGEYPASSTSAGEATNEITVAQRGPIFLLATNGVLILGGPLANIVFLIVLSAAGKTHLHTVWRICFGIGIIPPLLVIYFRMQMLSPKLYRKGAIKHRVPYKLALKRYWKTLIGTAGTWFLWDFVIFPNIVFSATIISSVIKDGDIKKTGEWQLLLSTFVIPGIIVGVLLCNPLGRRKTLYIGFAGYLVFALAIGCAYEKLTKIVPLFVVLYGMMHSAGAVGPGNLMGLVSAEPYATPVRGTFYGISAAFGKTGAAVGTQVFTPIQEHLGKRWTFIVSSICSILGIVLTYFFIPDMTGVDFADEDQKFLQYLADNGWTGDIGEEDETTLTDSSSVQKEG
ncbi:MFS general substrate transporter [Wolfiporia cocos MD-104 SS10]|uniref:MFS general substrate transporter n=1 Tax=Wolfiporia cocos (strain MD-104) TaxID=742152 RepID=A0A2H3IV16_WOLCO|nr:MFS general substrate transporter [Wolfiporia cocos MD-104 SS10]